MDTDYSSSMSRVCSSVDVHTNVRFFFHPTTTTVNFLISAEHYLFADKIGIMQNAAVAAIFDEIADYMEMAGENTFKIRAYRRAAEAVATFVTPIEEAAENNSLQSIEGLGEATSAKVREFLATGQVRALENLREQYPAGLLDLVRVPGLGPKRVAQLYHDKQIASVEALNAALESGALQGVSGFGPKTIENIKSGLRRLAQMKKRLPISAALPLAHEIVTALRTSSATTRVEIAGSLRRGRDTLGDINLQAATTEPSTLLRDFVALPQTLAVEEENATSASIRVRPGITVRLQTSTPDSFGSAWFFATGSPAHLEVAQQLAAKKGYELRPDGLFRNGNRIAGHEEQEIYAALGVPFIVPELRENRGEWNAAQANELPHLVTENDIRGDLHTHSTWSDGSLSIRQMAEACRARGYEYFAVTDHSQALAMANGLNAARLREQAREIAEVQADFSDLKILRGVECDIMRDGSLDLDDEILHELDIVVASVHSAFTLDGAAQTARVIKAVRHPAVDILAHPTGRVLGVRPPYDLDVRAVIEAARDSNTTLEINSSERLDLNDEHAFAARQAGVLLAIDSDAHSQRMLPSVAYGVLTARRAWCQKQDVLDALPIADLMRWLQRGNEIGHVEDEAES
jgi:DNA polymerase (family 10)